MRRIKQVLIAISLTIIASVLCGALGYLLVCGLLD